MHCYIMKSNDLTGNYHGDMNFENYTRWITEKNGSYKMFKPTNKSPFSNSSKAVMKKSLTKYENFISQRHAENPSIRFNYNIQA